MYKIFQSDILDWVKNYEGEKFHAVLCDPPYHLTSIVKRFGKPDSAPAQFGKDGVYKRHSTGFMQATWDGGDVAFRPETWEAIGNLLYPGAFGIAFASCRGYHRMVVAIEDAGFVIHPMIGWLQSQGFPKATRIDSQIDKQAGAERTEIIGKRHRNVKPYDDENGWNDNSTTGDFEYTAPVTDLAKTWVGHRYGLQALAPSLEPICMFQKPYEGRPLDNITQTGAGAINIDRCRIKTNDDLVKNYKSVRKSDDVMGERIYKMGFRQGKDSTAFATESNLLGRWPKNFVLDVEAAEIVDRQSGISKSAGGRSGHTGAYGGGYKQEYYGEQKPGYGDVGTASRFFFQVQEQIDEGDPVRYCAKVSPSERNAGLDEYEDQIYAQSGGAQARLRQGDEEYKQDSLGMNRIRKVKNNHPTLKPISLTEYLARLILPPSAYAPRRLLVPFSGAMSEAIGAMLAGWEEIVAIEMMSEYVKIGKARMDFWQTMMRETGLTDPRAILNIYGKLDKGKQDSPKSSPSYNFFEITEEE